MMQARWIGVLLLVALALSWAAAPVAGDAGITEHRPATRPLDPSATAVPSLTTDRSSSLTTPSVAGSTQPTAEPPTGADQTAGRVDPPNRAGTSGGDDATTRVLPDRSPVITEPTPGETISSPDGDPPEDADDSAALAGSPLTTATQPTGSRSVISPRQDSPPTRPSARKSHPRPEAGSRLRFWPS